MSKIIITCAITGSIHTPSMSPHLPVTPDDIAHQAIEAAEAGELPRLVELADVRGAFHNHTTASDGSNTLAEMTAAAQALGWDYLGIADHSKASFQAKGLSEERLEQQIREERSHLTSTQKSPPLTQEAEAFGV